MESALNFKNSMACYVHWYDCFGWVFRAAIFPVSQLSSCAASCFLFKITSNKMKTSLVGDNKFLCSAMQGDHKIAENKECDLSNFNLLLNWGREIWLESSESFVTRLSEHQPITDWIYYILFVTIDTCIHFLVDVSNYINYGHRFNYSWFYIRNFHKKTGCCIESQWIVWIDWMYKRAKIKQMTFIAFP